MDEFDRCAQNRPASVLLEKKHSSGDLQSRLKTRKILGVGETDNGDVHRSKISQVLGHNEHLYIKFPKYYSVWHFFLASLYTVCGLTNVIIFHRNARGKPPFENKPSLTLTEEYGRLYGCEMLGFAVLLWTLWGRSDRSLARALMTAIAVSESLQVGVTFLSSWNGETQWSVRLSIRLFASAVTALVNLYFVWAIGSSTAGLRKAPSYKDVADQEPEQDATAAAAACQECHSPLIKSNCTSCNAKKTE